MSPRIFRVIALPAPSDREKTQMYMQRYLPHLPAAGEIVIFDRSWYNRAGVERVMGFCSKEEVKVFLRAVPLVERAIIGSGVLLLKYWLEVSEEEQTRRLQARINDERKIWKLSQLDLDSYSHWYDYSRARDDMFLASDTDVAPWFVAQSNDKKRVRLNIISHLLASIPYEPCPGARSSCRSGRSKGITASRTARCGTCPNCTDRGRSRPAGRPSSKEIRSWPPYSSIPSRKAPATTTSASFSSSTAFPCTTASNAFPAPGNGPPSW